MSNIINPRKIPTRAEIMNSNSVHNLTKQVLELSKDKDVVDRYYDVLLAMRVLEREMIESIKQ